MSMRSANAVLRKSPSLNETTLIIYLLEAPQLTENRFLQIID
jgi:hypothetical protein